MELIGIGPRQCRHIKCRCSKDSLGLTPGPSPAERAHLEESDLICLAGRDAKTFKMRLELCMDAAVHEQIKWRWGHGALLMGVGGGAETLCSHFPMKVDEELIERLRNDDENPSELPPWEALEGLNQFPHAVVVGDHSDETTDKQRTSSESPGGTCKTMAAWCGPPRASSSPCAGGSPVWRRWTRPPLRRG